MDYRHPTVPSSTGPARLDEYYSIAARYADRRGRTGAMASLEAEAIANMSGSVSRSVEVLYPGTSKLSGGLLTSLIRTPELDHNYVQRFQNIAIIAQLADAILSVAQATGKCIVPLDFDSNEYASPEDCTCGVCSNERRNNNDGLGTQSEISKEGKEEEILEEGKKEKIIPDLLVKTLAGREELKGPKQANIFFDTEINTNVDEMALGSSACVASMHCRPPINPIAPLHQMDLQETMEIM